MKLLVRPSRSEDLEAIQTIYAHHVTHGLASFEEVPPDLPEIGQRREAVLAQGLPWLTAEMDGAVVGYAYATPYRTRSAYRYALENSVYVAPDQARRGIGRALLARLITLCEAGGYRQMIAVIGDSANRASIGLHEALGFRRVGLLPAVGFKFGRWVDIVIMQRPLGPGDATQPS